jgi:Glycosyl transferase family 2
MLFFSSGSRCWSTCSLRYERDCDRLRAVAAAAVQTLQYERGGHNEAKTIRQCVCSLEVDEIVVVDDGSTDEMWLEVQRLEQEGIIAKAIRLPSRQS